jgi:hypothetical protein
MPHGDFQKLAAAAAGSAPPRARGRAVLVGGFPTSQMKVVAARGPAYRCPHRLEMIVIPAESDSLGN